MSEEPATIQQTQTVIVQDGFLTTVCKCCCGLTALLAVLWVIGFLEVFT